MGIFSIIVLACAAVSALLYLRAARLGLHRQRLLLKPLTTTLLLGLALAAPVAHPAPYQLAICVGLLFSLAGDVLLMLTPVRFVAGLSSFLLAHIAYLLAFTRDVPIGSLALLMLPLGVSAVLVLRLLWPGLAGLRVPVLLYLAAIVLMAWTATARGLSLPSPGTTLAATGALLFMLSDSLLALNRFHKPLTRATEWIMASYWLAQACIALSVGVL